MRCLTNFVIFTCLMAMFSCDGGNKVYTPDPRMEDWKADTTTISLTPPAEEDTLSKVEVDANQQLIINLAQIVGADRPTSVSIKVNFEPTTGKMTTYTVTTSASRGTAVSKPPKPPATAFVISNYTIQSGDTKSSLARKFGIDINRIKNKTLISGQKLHYE